MDHEAAAIRQELRRLSGRGRTEALPDALRERVIAYAQSRRPSVSWARLGATLTLSPTTVKRWYERALPDTPTANGAAALLPVVVTPEAPATTELALVSPRGFRIEGLSLDDAAQLLERLA